MRNVMLRRMVLLLAILLLAPGGSWAVEQRRNWFGFFTGVGFGDEEIVGNDEKDNPNPLAGLRWDHYVCYDRAFFADASYLEYQGSQGVVDTREVLGRLGVMKHFGKEDDSRWFVAGALGYFRLDPDNVDHTQGALLGAGFGQRYFFGSGNGALHWEVRPELLLDSLQPQGGNMLNFKATVGWSFGFGGFRDEDGDGVVDCRDQCEATPQGADVDEHGCPKDTDGDGVFDGIDRCPDTPRGFKVDATGCPTDADRDGVPDGEDACPDTPAGAQVDSRGCPKDADGDGVFDGIDRCPDTPRGAKVDARGCPLDADGDGVFDGIDRCPNTPRGAKVDATGCPIPEPPKAPPVFEPGKKSLVLEGVTFEHDKAVLTPASTVVLDRVAASLRDWPEVRVEVAGHTDSDGNAAYNRKLSESRAEAVLRYLTEHGVDASRIRAKGYGEANPVADNASETGKALNRRVELTKIE